MILNRFLQGFLWTCEDPNCSCTQPMIEEVVVDVVRGEEVSRTLLWQGEFASDPSPIEEKMLREDLEEACRRHKLEEDPFEPGVWEREL